ncbi:MAG: bifunctional adenosylcobinamide kinase/adenosylcobinamide-phosphate guanylyltransferase [Pseudomonadota bacterium]
MEGTDSHRIILVGGGARSGKSAFAVSLARRLGARRAFVATAQALDPEMRERIDHHVRERGGDFQTIEEPVHLPARIEELRNIDVVVVDCLTLWLSNLLLQNTSPSRILERVEELSAAMARRRFHAIVVTNEVGMGLVPETALGRDFRDICGRAHQRIAQCADEIYLTVLGSVLRLPPGPVTAVTAQSSGGYPT